MARATLAARHSHITDVGQIEAVHLFKDQLYVQGNQPWNLVTLVDVSKPSPPLEHTIQRAQAMDQQQIQQQQVAQQQQLNQAGPQGPVMG